MRAGRWCAFQGSLIILGIVVVAFSRIQFMSAPLTERGELKHDAKEKEPSLTPPSPSLPHQEQQVQLSMKIKSVELNACHVKANEYIRNRVRTDMEFDVPLLASIVRAPVRIDHNISGFYWTAHLTLVHKIWRSGPKQKHRMPEFTTDAIWKCDDQEAVLEGQGDEGGNSLNIRCPQTDPSYVISNITVNNNYTYYVRDHVECEMKHPLKEPAPDAKVAAAVVIFKMNLHQALEWIEYHRLIGVDHFFLYVMDADLVGWPDLDYITYVPWKLNHRMLSNHDIFLFQIAAQVNAILRGRAHGLDWVTMNDMDEYWEPRGENRTFRGYLDERFNDNVPAISGQTVSFGNKPGTVTPQPLLLDYVWRAFVTFGPERRTKCIVRPTHVDYYRIHWISGGTGPAYWAKPQELWVHHYKEPQKGVFRPLRELHLTNITLDTSLRDRFSEKVGIKVEDILSRIEKSEASVT